MKSKNKNINLSINCNGKLVDLNTPKVMGVLNITPDSFYDGGRYKDAKSILNQTEKLISEGATFIDIGAYSSRPGADFISENEELKRIMPVVELIQKNNPDVLISIDSFRAKVIREGVSAGAVISNDISAGKLDPDMIKTVGELGVPYIMMHMRGTPQTMKNHTTYQHLINEIYAYFSKQIELARQHNITDIIIDPGFGFAKTLAQNYELGELFAKRTVDSNPREILPNKCCPRMGTNPHSLSNDSAFSIALWRPCRVPAGATMATRSPFFK